MATIKDIEQALRQRDADLLVTLMFEASGGPPSVRQGFKTENELWDYKGDCPQVGRDHENAWAHIAKDVLAFHNLKGGLIVFGFDDHTFSFRGATTRLDSKLLNDGLRRYIGDRIWVDYVRVHVQENQRYVGLALVPIRGPTLERFRSDAPTINGKKLFEKGQSAIRSGDESKLLSTSDADELSHRSFAPRIGQIFSVDEPFFKILAPEYQEFTGRERPCAQVEAALASERAAVTSVIGIGGVGKTALATWAVSRAYAPLRGPDRALIFREWGMLLRNSGAPDSTDQAIEKFEEAHAEAPNDVVTIDALSRMHDRKGAYRKVIALLEPMELHPHEKTRILAVPLLAKAYERVGELLKLAELRRRNAALLSDQM